MTYNSNKGGVILKLIKRLVCILIAFAISITMFSTHTNAEDISDYRQIVFKTETLKTVFKPTAQIGIKLNSNTEVLSYAGLDTGYTTPPLVVIKAKVGDKVTVYDHSKSNNSSYIDLWDYQVSTPHGMEAHLYNSSAFSPDKAFKDYTNYTLTESGTYNFYLCSRDYLSPADKASITDNYGNWSENGNHQALGINPGADGISGTADDFTGYWYYTQIRVVVEPVIPTATDSINVYYQLYKDGGFVANTDVMHTVDVGSNFTIPVSYNYNYLDYITTKSTNQTAEQSDMYIRYDYHSPAPQPQAWYSWYVVSAKHTSIDTSKTALNSNAYMPIYPLSNPSSIINLGYIGNSDKMYSYSSANITPIINTIRSQNGLDIDIGSSTAIINGNTTNIGDSGLDYGLYLAIDNDLTYCTGMANTYDFYIEYKNKGFRIEPFNTSIEDSNDCTVFSHNYYPDNLNNIFAINPLGDVYLDKANTTSPNNNKIVKFTLYDTKNFITKYTLVLVLYTPDGRYNYITKTITK